MNRRAFLKTVGAGALTFFLPQDPLQTVTHPYWLKTRTVYIPPAKIKLLFDRVTYRPVETLIHPDCNNGEWEEL